jgi:hypothetical protein
MTYSRHPVLGAEPAFAIGLLATKIGVVDLHPTVELPRVFSQAHGLYEFVFDQPGALVANAQIALEFQNRDVVLRLGKF